jgi:hypothetical protein
MSDAERSSETPQHTPPAASPRFGLRIDRSESPGGQIVTLGQAAESRHGSDQNPFSLKKSFDHRNLSCFFSKRLSAISSFR